MYNVCTFFGRRKEECAVVGIRTQSQLSGGAFGGGGYPLLLIFEERKRDVEFILII